MKRLVSIVLALSMVLCMTSCKKKSDFDPIAEFGSDVLNLYNWGEYITNDVIYSFEEKYNVTVNYSVYNSNEEMYTKLMSGASYDVIIPSDYMVERLIDEDMLQPIDKSVITNLDSLDEAVLNQPCDPDFTYMVPYLWQNVGIIYDSTKVDPEKVEELGWDIFLDEEYKGHVYMYDSERDSFMMGLKALGYSCNTDNVDEINEAYDWLRAVDKAVSPAYVMDEVIDSMIDGLKWIAVVYSGDAAYIINENEDMRYSAPYQGTNFACDCMVIPKNATNPKLANVFINYVLEYDNAYSISEEYGYASPVTEVLEDLTSEGGEYYENEAYIPRSGYDKDEYFHNNEVMKKMLSDLWIKVKLHK